MVKPSPEHMRKAVTDFAAGPAADAAAVMTVRNSNGHPLLRQRPATLPDDHFSVLDEREDKHRADA
jgi:hypothetical protein